MLGSLCLLCAFLVTNLAFAQTGPNNVPKTKEEQRASSRQTPKKKAAPATEPVVETAPAEEAAPEPDFRPRPASYQTSDFSKGQVGVELLGAGILYSFNGSYRPIRNLAINAGVSSIGVNSVNITLLPISVSGLFGDGNSNFEVLGGAIPVLASGKVYGSDFNQRVTRSGILGQVGVGYRYWPLAGGFHFRVMLMGIFGGGSFLPWPAFNFGYAF
jgi:hypothetical protein